MIIFKHPWVLLFLPALIFLAYHLKRHGGHCSIRFSSGELLRGLGPTLRLRLAGNLPYLRLMVLVLFLLALARPQLPLERVQVETEGVDIVLAIDASTSMLAEDFKLGGIRKNRLAVAKEVVADFIQKRASDRIGLIAFAAFSYTACPLTLDYSWLLKNLERVEIGSIEDGTAIGSAISSALNRLRDTQAKSKIVILLTDGVNNTGRISPLTAAEAARALGVKVYTIGAGTRGLAPYPVQDFFGRTVYRNVKVEIDQETLQKIAELTGGKYYRAADTESLRQIYDEIDALEKTPVQDEGFREYQELFARFLVPGILLLLLEIILSNTWLRRLP